MRKLFGTDGIRGVANAYPMTPEMIVKIGRAVAYRVKDAKKRCSIFIGKDTRLSGYMMETALAAGICSMGVDVLLSGPIPTPGVAYLTSSMRADAGVVISASHNPYQDNGIKFFSGTGFKLPDQVEADIEKTVFENRIDELRPTATEVGKAYRIADAAGRYIVFVKNSFPKECTLDGIKIVVDCANGAAYRVAPSVFGELNANVVPYQVNPNGKNINKNCGALHPEGMQKLVVEEGADIGIALDGDGDRAIFSDSKGNIVDGDKVMAIAAKFMKEKGLLKKDTIVATVMSNFGTELYLKKQGIKMLRARVGDRYVVEDMLAGGFNVGGEQSGHIIFLDYNTTGDGLITSLQLLSIMKSKGKSLSELAGEIPNVPQVLKNVKVREKRDFEKMKDVAALIKEAESKLKGEGRVLLRYSGTELLARIMVEGTDDRLVEDYASKIANAVRTEIGEES